MSDLLQINNETEQVLRRLEVILRGSQSKVQSQEVEELVNYSHRIFHYFHDIVIHKREAVTVDNPNDYIATAVKLHNKVRNLNLPLLSRTKNLLRASSAWMLVVFGEKSSKIMSVIIKLLSKSGEELIKQPETKTEGLQCFDAAMSLWKSANEVPIFDQLPTLEMQDIKLCVFKSLQGVVINTSMDSFDLNELKQTASFGVELAESLDDRFQLSLVEMLLKIGQIFSNQHTENEGKRNSDAHGNPLLVNAGYFLMLAVTILRKPIFQSLITSSDGGRNDLHKTDENSSVVRTFLDLRVRVYLALVMVYTNTDELDKAMACINAIEEAEKLQQKFLNESLSNTISFSKLMIAACQGDVEKTELSVKALLKNPKTPFKTSIAAIKRLQGLMKETDRDKVSDYYKQLAAKYCSDPEFTSIRIAHLQSTLGNLKALKDDEQYESRARDISTRIVSDHLHQLHVLGHEEFQLFRSILCDQVNWYKSLKMWQYVKSWCDILISLIEHVEEENDCASTVYAIKVESLMQTHQIAEAVNIAQRLASRECTVRSLTTLFKALIHSDDESVDGIMSRLLHFHNHKMSRMSPEEKLDNLLICAHITQSTPSMQAQKRYTIIQRLFQTWMNVFVTDQAWKHLSPTSSTASISFMEVMTDCQSRSTFHLIESFNDKYSAMGMMPLDSPLVRQFQKMQQSFQQREPSNISSIVDESSNPEAMDAFSLLKALSLLQPVASSSMMTHYVQFELLPSMELMVTLMEQILLHSDDSVDLIGSRALIVNLADVSYKYMLVMLDIREVCSRKKLSIVNKDSSNSNSDTKHSESVNEMLDHEVWSSLADLTQTLYNLADPSLKKQRVLCLVLSAVSYMDAFDFNTSNIHNTEDLCAADLDNGEKSQHKELIEQAMIRLHEASAIQRDYIDFASKEDEHLRSVIFILLTSAFSRTGTVSESETFVLSYEREISVLDDENMKHFIDLLSQSRRFSVEAVRKALELCSQALHCKASIPPLLGWVYRKLVELSPSRKYACGKLEEAVTTLEEAYQGTESLEVLIFSNEDVDNMVARAYNSSLMLVDLDQLVLAEQFVHHSISLCKYASEETKLYLPRMQDTLQYIKHQSRSNQSAAVTITMPINGGGPVESEAINSIQATPEHGKVGHLNPDMFTKASL